MRFHRTTDGGATWTTSIFPGAFLTPLVADPTTPGVVLVGNREEVWRSTDGGATWIVGGIPFGSAVTVLAVSPSAPDTVWAGSRPAASGFFNEGIYKSTDGGQTFALSTFVFDGIVALAVDPTDADTVYASDFSPSLGLLKTSDGGASWGRVGTGLPATDFVTSIAVDPADALIVFASAGDAVLKSVDARLHVTVTSDQSRHHGAARSG